MSIHVFIFSFIVGITTDVLGVGYFDGNIPLAIAANVIPVLALCYCK